MAAEVELLTYEQEAKQIIDKIKLCYIISQAEFAKNLLKTRLELDLIAESTGLSIVEIQKTKITSS